MTPRVVIAAGGEAQVLERTDLPGRGGLIGAGGRFTAYLRASRVLTAVVLLPFGALAAQRPVRVCGGGDVATASPGADPQALIAPLRPLFAGATIVLVNIEGVVGAPPSSPKCQPGARNCWEVRQPAGTALALRSLASPTAIVVGNVSNNHAHDAGLTGWRETARRLHSAGVLVTGADTLATPVMVAEGDTVGVLGFGVSSLARQSDLAAVRRHVARAVARYHRVIVTMHLGGEGAGARHVRDVTEVFAGENRGNPVAFARAASNAGASLVLGHGPHVLRAITWVGRTLVAYSLGNLLTNGAFNMTGYTGRAVVLCATVRPDGSVADGMLRSTRQRPPGIVAADPGGVALRDIIELNQQDVPGTGAVVAPDGTITRRP